MLQNKMAATMAFRSRCANLRLSSLNAISWRQFSFTRAVFAETKEANKENGSKAGEETKLSELEQKLTEEKEKLTAQVADFTDKYKRALAETENVRMRFTKQLNDSKLYSISGFCKDLLEVADILGKATTSVPKDAVDGADANIHLKNLYEGLIMTESQLQKVFAKNKLEQINPVNDEKFDPNVHEALFEIPIPGKEPGTVAVVEKIGYRLHERTLRPALVGVTKAS
ncbi:grpE protein homolog 1, mitochondrial-like [Lytechinus variegatus]|uniref:grpE protein homolog 1, mitochondrial-like n=1 Tax=Lytechinus variegatus TaxID=7654 RepID=UPI001BB21621|nr:grpE protein homolog 1, mitochondrial-like [Lytechinus variegatus]